MKADKVYFERSIPAHAGEPAWRFVFPFSEKVYPRPRGGTARSDFIHPSRLGLSPPTRGNRMNALSYNDYQRSIPAHAGEPPRPCA